MRAAIVLLLTLLAMSLVVVAMQPATAHNVPPRYNGNAWGARCLVPAPRITPTTCCERTSAGCMGGCKLADESSNWVNACRANCQAAGEQCLRHIQPRGPAIDRPGTAPPSPKP